MTFHWKVKEKRKKSFLIEKIMKKTTMKMILNMRKILI